MKPKTRTETESAFQLNCRELSELHLDWGNKKSYGIFECEPAHENCLSDSKKICFHVLCTAYFLVLRIDS